MWTWFKKTFFARVRNRFEQVNEYAVAGTIPAEDMNSMLAAMRFDEQLHVTINSIEKEAPLIKTWLVQRVPKNAHAFYLCTMAPHTISPWLRISAQELNDKIAQSNGVESTTIGKWKLLTPAQEGQTFGQY